MAWSPPPPGTETQWGQTRWEPRHRDAPSDAQGHRPATSQQARGSGEAPNLGVGNSDWRARVATLRSTWLHVTAACMRVPWWPETSASAAENGGGVPTLRFGTSPTPVLTVADAEGAPTWPAAVSGRSTRTTRCPSPRRTPLWGAMGGAFVPAGADAPLVRVGGNFPGSRRFHAARARASSPGLCAPRAAWSRRGSSRRLELPWIRPPALPTPLLVCTGGVMHLLSPRSATFRFSPRSKVCAPRHGPSTSRPRTSLGDRPLPVVEP